MKGKYSLEIKSRKVVYKLEFERNITVIKGNSGTGKSSMIRLIADYIELGRDSGVQVLKNTEYRIAVFSNRTEWADELEKARKSIIFIDEDVRYLYKKDFQTLLWKSDCYVVIISRSGRFSHLPFAINSIYELRTNPTGKMFMTQMYRIYKNQNAVVRATAAVVEDSNAGFEMMRKIFSCNIESAGGNGNIIKCLINLSLINGNIAVIVDGAAFGGYINAVFNIGKVRDNITVFAPESFEFLLLTTSVFKHYLSDQLQNTWKYCDSLEFITWERYYTKLLQDMAWDNYHVMYSKSRLHHFFENNSIVKEVIEQLQCMIVSE